MRVMMLRFIVITVLITGCASNTDRYAYVDVAAGHFPDRRADNDGEIPAWISLGVAREYQWGETYVELYHRSNLDKGWPFSTAGEDEYMSNGLKIGTRLRVIEL